MKSVRYISILLCFVFLFLCGCDKKSDSTQSASSSSIQNVSFPSQMKILYSSKDTLDPYTCATQQNRIVSQLIFDPLIKLDNSYNIIYCLAKSAVIEGKSCTVNLNNVMFSDGTKLTASDVIFSFNKAKNSSTKFKTAMSEATGITGVSESIVRFSLTRYDPYFINLLTFPILKSGSDNLKDNDNKALPPIGCGRYVFTPSSSSLTPNTHYFGGTPKIARILTVDCPDDESVLEAVESHMVDFYFTDMSNNDIPKMNGNTADISQNHIVFLGVNAENSALSNVYLRQAVSAAIDRDKICDESYFSKASPANGVFPSDWSPVSTYQTIEKSQNIETAKNNLLLAGFKEKNKDGYYKLPNGNSLTLTLIVNNENKCRAAAAQVIVDNLKSCGINAVLRSEKYNQYINDLKSGNYNLYLSEIRIEDNMDLGNLSSVMSGKKLTGVSVNSSKAQNSAVSSKNSSSKESSGSSSNVSSSSSTVSSEPEQITITTSDAVNGLYGGKYKITDVVTAFTAELPVIPVAYKSGLAIYNGNLSGIKPCLSDLFYGI